MPSRSLSTCAARSSRLLSTEAMAAPKQTKLQPQLCRYRRRHRHRRLRRAALRPPTMGDAKADADAAFPYEWYVGRRGWGSG
mmetsp:Transcript_27075/g.85116  ORF Transcript_27075/g.85116 Transcript_27075/m.85116 type:complete len:82 (-) Transcript_27075:2138-2383(-)